MLHFPLEDRLNQCVADFVDHGGIPVIDLAPLRMSTDPSAVASALHKASREVGFIYVTNHGLPQDVIDRARRVALDFFRLPELAKSKVRISPQHRGWLRPGAARMQDGIKADLKESYLWGSEDDPTQPRDHSLRGPNRWPSELPELRDAAMAFFDHGHRLARDLMRGFALGLNMPADFFLRSSCRPLSRGSFVYYPPQASGLGSDQFGVGPHTDFGVLTILCQDDVGGLEVQKPTGQWVAARPIDGTLVVNVGDLLARWTNDEYRSTPHRVLNSSGRERLSLVLAYDPDPQTLVDPAAVFGPARFVRYAPITCGEYLERRFARAFDYRGALADHESAADGD